MGRIQPGADAKRIEAQMIVELQQWLSSPVAELKTEERALIPKQTLHFAPGGSGVRMMRDEYQDGLHLLMWISGFVLMIACANVANLMLVRATTRKQQTSIRAALGAPRSRQIRQVLTESTVLALLGAIAGVGLAYGGTRLILHLAFQKELCAHPGLAFVAGAGFHVPGVTADGRAVWCCSGLDDGECRSRGSLARCKPFHGARRFMDAEVTGGLAGGVVSGASVRSRFADAESAEHAQSALWVRDAESLPSAR